MEQNPFNAPDYTQQPIDPTVASQPQYSAPANPQQPYYNAPGYAQQPYYNAPMPPTSEKKPKNPFITYAILGVICASVIVLALCLTGVFSSDTYEGGGYSSSEDAALAYVEAMQDGDTEAMLSTFAIETAAENFKFDEYHLLQDFLTYDLSPYNTSWAMLPTDTDFGYDLAVERRAAQLSEYVSEPFFMAKEGAFKNFEKFEDSFYEQTYDSLKTQEQRDEFCEEYRDFDAEDFFSDIEITDVYVNSAWANNPEEFHERRDAIFEALGAEDYNEMQVEFELNGKVYTVGLTTICYDGEWYNYGKSFWNAQHMIIEKEG